jgi:hypothetical protein
MRLSSTVGLSYQRRMPFGIFVYENDPILRKNLLTYVNPDNEGLAVVEVGGGLMISIARQDDIADFWLFFLEAGNHDFVFVEQPHLALLAISSGKTAAPIALLNPVSSQLTWPVAGLVFNVIAPGTRLQVSRIEKTIRLADMICVRPNGSDLWDRPSRNTVVLRVGDAISITKPGYDLRLVLIP